MPTGDSAPPNESSVVPLYERAGKYTVSAALLQDFIAQAKAAAGSVGNRFADQDGGPTGGELVREVDWLLDDAIAGTRLVDAAPSAAEWQPTTWSDLSLRLRLGGDTEAREVLLRADVAALQELWRRRIEERVPFQYLVGCAHWRDEILAVGPGVLIPRPETELMVDLCEAAVKAAGAGPEGGAGAGPPRLPAAAPWADLGTGSGALAIGLARVVPAEARVVAVEASPAAAALARLNVRRCGLQGRVEVREGSWFEPLQALEGHLAGVVSNPPYIPSGALPALQAEVIGHEPAMALDGGDGEGLDDLRRIVEGARRALLPGGMLALETGGADQTHALKPLMEQGGYFDRVEIVADFASIERFIVGFRTEK